MKERKNSMVSKKLQIFLKASKIKYEALSHKTVYTAFDTAATLKKKLQEVAKTLVLKVEPGITFGKKTSNYILIVLPASLKADLQKLKKLLKVKKIEIVKERAIEKALKVKGGAVPPFAFFLKVPTYLDRALSKTKSIIANAGSHTDSLKVKVKELVKAGGKVIGSFGKKK